MEVLRTDQFAKWLRCLRDARARLKIVTQVDRLAAGNPGKSRSVGGGIVELKIDFGPGYRVYYTMRRSILIVVLCGGDKSTQDEDIRQAKSIAAALIDKE